MQDPYEGRYCGRRGTCHPQLIGFFFLRFAAILRPLIRLTLVP